jgi:hypothetical protein
MAVTPPALSFDAPTGGPDPAPQALAITNESGGELTWTVSGAPDWLAVDPPSGMAPSEMSVSPHVAGLVSGTYTATLAFEGGPDCANCPVDVPVSLTVHGQPFLAVTPPELAFDAVQGQTEPVTRTLELQNIGPGFLTWTLTLDAGWLQATPMTGTLPPPETVTVAADPTGLDAGTYATTIVISGPVECQNCPVDVPVALTVEPPPVIVVTPPEVRITATADDPNPAPEKLTVTNAGGGELVWEAEVDVPWLWTEPVSGTAGELLWLHFDIAGLEAGVHPGELTIRDVAGLAEPVEVAVPVELTLLPGAQETYQLYLPLIHR